MAGVVEGYSAEECHRGNRLERLVDVEEGLLHAECQQHYPRDHREVQVAVGVARDPEPALAFRLSEVALGDKRDNIEVRPPEREGDDQAQEGRGHGPGVELAVQPGADRDDRLPEGDDQDQREALREMARRHAEAAYAEDEGPGEVRPQRKYPDQRLR